MTTINGVGGGYCNISSIALLIGLQQVYTVLFKLIYQKLVCKISKLLHNVMMVQALSENINGLNNVLIINVSNNDRSSYIHCMAHKLNLVLVSACTTIPIVRAFFDTMHFIYSIFAEPSPHDILKKL